jgi:hypothetical protein
VISSSEQADWRQRAVFRAVGLLRRSVAGHPAWDPLARRLGLAGPSLLPLQAILRRPGLTLGGYAEYLPGYAPELLLDWLDRLVASEVLHISARGKYWPGPAAGWWDTQAAAATERALAAWARLPSERLAALAEHTGRLLAAIPAASLNSHPLYAYGIRSAGAAASRRALSAALALANYHSDAYRLAWSSGRLPARHGVVLRLGLAAGPGPPQTLDTAARRYLGAGAAAAIADLLAAGWLTAGQRDLRLTASGWSAALAVEQAVREDCAPIAAALSAAEIRSLGQTAACLERMAARIRDSGFRSQESGIGKGDGA